MPDVNVTAPGISPQTVGQPLTLQCEVTTVRGITSRVDIVWSSDGTLLQSANNSMFSSMIDDSLIHTDSYTVEILSTDDEDRSYYCAVLIYATPQVMANDSVTLDVTGRY